MTVDNLRVGGCSEAGDGAVDAGVLRGLQAVRCPTRLLVALL